MDIRELFLDFFLPKMCVSCGKLEVFLCEECRENLEYATQICPQCGEESVYGWTHERCKKRLGMDGLITIYDYQEEVIRKVIDGIKFGFNRYLIVEVLRDFQFESGVDFDFLVPVPLFYYRENWRGFNQAEDISKLVGNMMGMRSELVLKRVRMTKQQSLLDNRKKREENIRNAFVVDEKWVNQIQGKKILLVDDVFTSGADMRECTKVLKESGVKVVWGLSLAH